MKAFLSNRFFLIIISVLIAIIINDYLIEKYLNIPSMKAAVDFLAIFIISIATFVVLNRFTNKQA